ncbi:MAG: hypothetical protein ACPICB_04895, partial [Candidatus Poseidoniaceae archaeon]
EVASHQSGAAAAASSASAAAFSVQPQPNAGGGAGVASHPSGAAAAASLSAQPQPNARRLAEGGPPPLDAAAAASFSAQPFEATEPSCDDLSQHDFDPVALGGERIYRNAPMKSQPRTYYFQAQDTEHESPLPFLGGYAGLEQQFDDTLSTFIDEAQKTTRFYFGGMVSNERTKVERSSLKKTCQCVKSLGSLGYSQENGGTHELAKYDRPVKVNAVTLWLDKIDGLTNRKRVNQKNAEFIIDNLDLFPWIYIGVLQVMHDTKATEDADEVVVVDTSTTPPIKNDQPPPPPNLPDHIDMTELKSLFLGVNSLQEIGLENGIPPFVSVDDSRAYILTAITKHHKTSKRTVKGDINAAVQFILDDPLYFSQWFKDARKHWDHEGHAREDDVTARIAPSHRKRDKPIRYTDQFPSATPPKKRNKEELYGRPTHILTPVKCALPTWVIARDEENNWVEFEMKVDEPSEQFVTEDKMVVNHVPSFPNMPMRLEFDFHSPCHDSLGYFLITRIDQHLNTEKGPKQYLTQMLTSMLIMTNGKDVHYAANGMYYIGAYSLRGGQLNERIGYVMANFRDLRSFVYRMMMPLDYHPNQKHRGDKSYALKGYSYARAVDLGYNPTQLPQFPAPTVMVGRPPHSDPPTFSLSSQFGDEDLSLSLRSVATEGVSPAVREAIAQATNPIMESVNKIWKTLNEMKRSC